MNGRVFCSPGNSLIFPILRYSVYGQKIRFESGVSPRVACRTTAVSLYPWSSMPSSFIPWETLKISSWELEICYQQGDIIYLQLRSYFTPCLLPHCKAVLENVFQFTVINLQSKTKEILLQISVSSSTSFYLLIIMMEWFWSSSCGLAWLICSPEREGLNYGWQDVMLNIKHIFQKAKITDESGFLKKTTTAKNWMINLDIGKIAFFLYKTDRSQLVWCVCYSKYICQSCQS